MEPQDDPEARIRELERPLTNQASTSELSVSHGYASPPPVADAISFGTTRPRTTGRVWWIVIAVFLLGMVGMVVGIMVYVGNVFSSSTGSFGRPSMYGGDGSFTATPSDRPGTSVRPSASSAPHGGRLSIAGVGKNETIECNDSFVSVSGMSNTVVLNGHCADITVSGVQNVVTVDTADTITASGVENQVTYHSGSPTVQNGGNSNVVEQG
jgi:hypothetical protein